MEPKHETKKLWINSFWRLSQVVSSGGFAALFSFIYTASLTKAEFTVYGVAVTFVQLLQLLSNFGLRQTATRFIAKSRGAGDYTDVAGFTRAGLGLAVGFSALALVLAAASNPLLTGFLSDDGSHALVALVVALIAGFAGVSLFLQGVLEGIGNFKPITLCSAALNLVQLALVGAFLFLGLSVKIVLFIELGVMVASILFYGSQVLRAYRRWPQKPVPLAPYRRQMMTYAVPLFINMVAGFLYTKVDILFVKAFTGGDETADYFLMMHIYSFPLQALGAYIFVLNTDIAYLVGQKDTERISRLFYRSEKMGLIFGLGMSVLFYFLSYAVVAIFPNYEGAGHLMRLVSPMLLLKSVSHIASGAFMTSLGYVKALAGFTIFGGCLNVGLNYLLIPVYGGEGAVYSTLIGHTINGAIFLGFIWNRIRHMRRTGELHHA